MTNYPLVFMKLGIPLELGWFENYLVMVGFWLVALTGLSCFHHHFPSENFHIVIWVPLCHTSLSTIMLWNIHGSQPPAGLQQLTQAASEAASVFSWSGAQPSRSCARKPRLAPAGSICSESSTVTSRNSSSPKFSRCVAQSEPPRIWDHINIC